MQNIYNKNMNMKREINKAINGNEAMENGKWKNVQKNLFVFQGRWLKK